MDKREALNAIESFRESSTSVIFDSEATATKADIKKLADKIANLAEKLVEASSK